MMENETTLGKSKLTSSLSLSDSTPVKFTLWAVICGAAAICAGGFHAGSKFQAATFESRALRGQVLSFQSDLAKAQEKTTEDIEDLSQKIATLATSESKIALLQTQLASNAELAVSIKNLLDAKMRSRWSADMMTVFTAKLKKDNPNLIVPDTQEIRAVSLLNEDSK